LFIVFPPRLDDRYRYPALETNWRHSHLFRLILHTFDPRSWLWFAQQLRISGNATPAMLPLALIGTLAFSAGPLSKIPFAHSILIVILAPLLLISLLGAALAMMDSLRSAFTDGFRGFTYSQQWFEAARAFLIAGVLMAIATAICIYLGFPIVELTGIPTATAFGIFLTGSAIGTLIAKKRNHKPSGDAYDCIDFFLPQFVAALAIIVPVILFAKLVDPMYVIVSTVVLALLSIAIIKLAERFRASSKNAG
jgi:hypothetical protein